MLHAIFLDNINRWGIFSYNYMFFCQTIKRSSGDVLPDNFLVLMLLSVIGISLSQFNQIYPNTYLFIYNIIEYSQLQFLIL